MEQLNETTEWMNEWMKEIAEATKGRELRLKKQSWKKNEHSINAIEAFDCFYIYIYMYAHTQYFYFVSIVFKRVIYLLWKPEP